MRATLLLLVGMSLAAGDDNLIENGSFAKVNTEGDLPVGWSREVHTREGAVGTVTWDKGALKIENRSAKSAWVRSSQTHVPAKPESLYRLSCRVRGSAHVTLLVYEFLHDKKPYRSHRLGQFVPGEAWARKAGTFRTGPDAKSFKVSLITDRAGDAWFDDVELRDLSEPPSLVLPRAPRSATIEPFLLLDGKGRESAEPTLARLSYDDQGLRVRFECRESQVGKMKTTQAGNGMAVFGDDCVEVFLSPDPDGQVYYQVGVNARGAKGFVRRASYTKVFRSWFDVGHRPSAPRWEPDVPMQTKVEASRWTVDVTMPWQAMGVTPKAGLVMRANFTRRRNLGGEENSSWALMVGETFHDPTQWGRLILGASPTTPSGTSVAAPVLPPAATIPDPADAKPAFAVRAFHSQAPLQRDVPAYRELVRTLAKLRFNTLTLEVNEKLQYERHPDIAHRDALSKSQMRELVQFCRGLGFDVIPQVQTWGHFSYVLRHEAYRSLAEPIADPHSRWRLWNYCPSNPDTYKLVFDLFEEVIEVFEPTSFHIGHDEITFTPIGVCPRCKGVPGEELFARDVLKLYQWLHGRKLKVMMWGDQLLAEHNGRPPYNTAKALPKMPRDLIMCDWHYSGWDDFPSVRFFKSEGFPVIACGWFNPVNIANFSRVAADASAEGYCMTTWWSAARVATTGRTAGALALSSQFAWAPKRFTLDTLPWHPAQAFRRIHFPARAKGSYRALDLSAQAQTPLEETDVAPVPRGTLSAAGVPFVIGGQAVALTPDRPKAWQVAVGGKVASLHFLHCTTRPDKVVDHLYDRHRVLPKRVGRYVVTYEDGDRETLSLVYRRNITHWNSKMGAGECDLAWQGCRDDGAVVTLCAWEWPNPHPDKSVTAIDLCRGSAAVDVIVLAVTAKQ